MSYNNGTNVWRNTYRLNREKARGENMDSTNNFGENSGPQSLPAFNTFYNKTNSSSFGAEGKNLNWGGSQSSSSGSSNTSSPLGSSSDLDRRVNWASMVDNVFREEIGKMAQGFKNGKL